MARIRTLKPEHKSHRKVGQLSDRAYRLWIGLLTEADDEGRVVCHPQQLRVVVFPYQKNLTDEKVERALDEVASRGLVRLYTVGGVRYAVIPSFGDHQVINKPTKSRIPAPTVALLESYRSPTVGLPTERNGTEGTEGKGTERKDGRGGAPRPAVASRLPG